MSQFTEHGFLGEDDLDFHSVFYQKHKEDIELCLEINRAAQVLLYKLNIHNEDGPELAASTLYSRVVSTYQAAFLVSMKGMRAETTTLIRCLLEPLFPLIAISKNREFTRRYVNTELIRRLKTLQGLQSYKKRNPQDPLKIDRQIIKSLESEVKKRGIEELSVRACAKEGGQLDLYDTVYNYTSVTLHASPISLAQAFELDATKTTITAVKHQPEVEGFEVLFPTMIDALGRAMIAVSTIFELEHPKSVDEAMSKLAQIHKST